jgi:hypothetical protein
MKSPWEWDEDDIQDLIRNQVQESLILDYKRCDALARTDAKKREVGKDVSAFANSAGGTIVYGVVENGHIPTEVDVGYHPMEISKEWLEHVINSHIQRRINGVRINPVQLTGSAPGKVLYVVWIPQSMRAPHMAADNRFYKRFNFESVPMEEYEVRDVASRHQAPDLQLKLQWQTPVGRDVPILEVRALISNEAPEVATHAVVNIYVDSRIVLISSAGLGGTVNHVLSRGNDKVPVYVLSMNWSLMRMPIWQGESFSLAEEPLVFGMPPSPGEYVFGWRISAPRMSPKQRFYTIRLDASSLQFVEHAV